MDGQMICQECHHWDALKFGHMYHSLAKTLIQILKAIQYRRAWRKRQHSSMMNTWKTPKRAVTVTIFTSNANAFTAIERSTNHMILRFAICLITGEVKHAFCSCVDGRIGFCNHALAPLMKVCLFSFYECKNTNDSMTTFLSLKRPAHLNFSSGIVKEEEVKSLRNQ